jgi:membrane protease YdiL (CAAX protease family)
MKQRVKNTYLEWASEGRSGLLLYILGFILVLAISLIIGQMFTVVGGLLIPSTSPMATIFKTNFFGFLFSFTAIPIMVRLLHNRPWWSVAMPERRLDYKRFAIGLISTLAVLIVLQIVGYISRPEQYHYNGFDPTQWIPLFFLAVIAFFVQASTEEMVYRGYITQFIYRFSKSPWLFLPISALIFSLPHFGNISGASGVFAIMPYLEMGLMFGWLAYRSGSLWMGIGAHVANNWFVTLFVGSDAENLKKLSLFTTISSQSHSSPADQSLSSLVFCLATILVAELIMRLTRTKVQGIKEKNADL